MKLILTSSVALAVLAVAPAFAQRKATIENVPDIPFTSAPNRTLIKGEPFEPRRVLSEFGLSIPASTEVRVHDSTADLRYIILPEQPAGTQGWSAAELEAVVTRDCMIGTAVPVVQKPKKAA